MKKKFNITGLCIKSKHYMVDILDKINKIAAMVDEGEYFTINRPRQFGKTTTLNILQEVLSERYMVIDSSFEGVGDDLFRTEEELCGNVFKIWADSVEFTNKEIYTLLLDHSSSKNFRELSKAISAFIRTTGQKVVLLIDEVDKSSNNRVFLQFLGMLRNKYLSASAGKDITFQSVILAGVHDIRTLKLAIRDENDARFNSPWNIAAKFEVDMSFNPREIESMLLDYQSETLIDFDLPARSEQIYMFTNGYPYLVSDICKIVDEKLGAVWTEESIYMAVKSILNEKTTLFEDVIKNIENNEDIKVVVNDLLLSGRYLSYHQFTFETGIMFGIFREHNAQERLIFLAYLKPILNGKGFYFVEPQTRENKRMDVVIIYDNQKYVVELKLWNGSDLKTNKMLSISLMK